MSLIKLDAENLSKKLFVDLFEKEGYVVVERVFSNEMVSDLENELMFAIEDECRKYHSKDHEDYGMLIACPEYGGNFLKIPDNKKYIEPFNWLLGDTCIIWTYTSSSLPPKAGNHSTRIHVDWPHFMPNYNPGIGSLILLNDFTIDNGATYLLPKSHLSESVPDSDTFYKEAIRLEATRGSVFYFNLRLWHAGGVNLTNKWRHAIGIGMARPTFKQKIDLPRAINEMDAVSLTQYAKQKFGYFSQVPISVAQYYENAKNRQNRQRSEWEEVGTNKSNQPMQDQDIKN